MILLLVENLFVKYTIKMKSSGRVNLPIYTVIIIRVHFFRINCKLTDLSILDKKQKFGKAGRHQLNKKIINLLLVH